MMAPDDDADDVISCWHRHTYSSYLGEGTSITGLGFLLVISTRMTWCFNLSLPPHHPPIPFCHVCSVPTRQEPRLANQPGLVIGFIRGRLSSGYI